MKILYAANNRPSSILQAKSIYNHLKDEFEIKIAGFYNLLDKIQLNWLLDPLYNNASKIKNAELKKKYNCNIKLVNNENFELLLSSINRYSPDLIISDNQQHINAIGKILGIETWDVSPVNHLWSATEFTWDYFYYHILYYYKRDYLKYVQPDKSFVYSSFYLLDFPILDTQEYIKPFDGSSVVDQETTAVVYNRSELRTIFSNFRDIRCHFNSDELVLGSMNFCTGETYYLSEILKSGQNYHVMPSLQDIETLINAVITRTLMSGIDLGQLELMQEHAHSRIERMRDLKMDYKINTREVPNLLEKIYEEF